MTEKYLGSELILNDAAEVLGGGEIRYNLHVVQQQSRKTLTNLIHLKALLSL